MNPFLQFKALVSKVRYVLLFILYLSLISPMLKAQNRSIQGKVLDEATNQPIPFAHISILESGIGTISNSDGFFVLKISADQLAKGVKISYIGYESQFIGPDRFSSQETLTIQLQPKSLKLEEVTVTAERQSAEEIVIQAYQNIRTNYEADSFFLTGYYKESEHHQNGDPVYISEAITQVSIPARADEREMSVHLLKSRKNELEVIKMKHIRGGVYWRVESPDKGLWEVMVPKKMKKFDYKIDSYTEYNGSPVAIISFENKKGRQYTGRFMIELENYAFIKVEVYRKHGSGMPTDNWKWTFKSNIDEYARNEQGKWFMKTSHFVGDWIFKKSKQQFQTRVAYTSTSFKRSNDYESQGSYFSQEDHIYAETSGYDESFWEGFQFISISELEKAALEKVRINSRQN